MAFKKNYVGIQPRTWWTMLPPEKVWLHEAIYMAQSHGWLLLQVERFADIVGIPCFQVEQSR